MIVNSTRQVITRSPHRSVGLINCKFFQSHPIVYESQLERAFVQECLLCPAVKRIVAQPFKVNLDPIKKKSYTPDYLVELNDKTYLVVEVKIAKRIAKLKKRFDQINVHLSLRGFPFMMADETQIYAKQMDRYAKAILRYVNWSVELEVKKVIFAQLEKCADQPIPFMELINHVHCSKEDALHLIATRQIFVTAITSISDLLIKNTSQGETHGLNYLSNWLGTSIWGSSL